MTRTISREPFGLHDYGRQRERAASGIEGDYDRAAVLIWSDLNLHRSNFPARKPTK
jgi:hypothetical protein